MLMWKIVVLAEASVLYIEYIDFFFFEKQTHTHRGEGKGSNTKTYHNSTQKSWYIEYIDYRWNSTFYLFFKVIKICVHNVNPQFKTRISRNWGQKINCVKYRTINSNVIRKTQKWVMIIIILLADKSKLFVYVIVPKGNSSLYFLLVSGNFFLVLCFFSCTPLLTYWALGKLAFFPLLGVR